MGVYIHRTIETAILNIFIISFTMAFINVIGEAIVVEMNRDKEA